MGNETIAATSVPTQARPGRTAARLARVLETALTSIDLSLSQYRVLLYLDSGNSAASALADKLAVTRPSVTTVVDGLVARGLVERHQDAQDRRKVGHAITDEGRHALAIADDAVEQRLAGYGATLADDDRDLAYRGLDLWRTAMDAVRESKMAARR